MDTSDENPYRELVENQQDLLVKFSTEGRLLFVNTAYCEALGKTKEELGGSIFMPATDQKYSEVMATQMTRLFRPPYTCQVEQWISSPQGPRCISWSARSITDGKGGVTAIVASGRDVTRLQREQRSIRKRDEELMLLLESGTPMYFTHSSDHTLRYVSPRIRALLGTGQKSGKRMWIDYLTDHPLNAKGLERTLKAIATGRREPPYRLEFYGRNNTKIWVEINEIPVVKNRVTVAIAGSLVDVTEKKRVEEGLIEAEILLKNYGSAKKGEKDPAGESSAGPFAALRSIFSSKKSTDEEDIPLDIPENLK
ncbi:putative PAS/PAC sensor protein [Methanoregula boonei 6A8]|uniref:Putative PAS/PAC sensor protein n=1 Tax=Methanoregula boonei (strain DSM 21154 / JCM 14090 / 6A8) TaxID=456442 RepID=A7IA32_METB6|nr:PAS domain-containing protein [Methanoregula boonei]ABS56593.1 putative PAS/PAC sensor protein [Methanoregula boonei 6A8]